MTYCALKYIFIARYTHCSKILFGTNYQWAINEFLVLREKVIVVEH